MSIDQGVALFLFAVMVLVCLLIWGFGIAEWRELRAGPPPPHDPVGYFDEMVTRWARGPGTLQQWLGGGPMPDPRAPGGGDAYGVVVAELVDLPDGSGTDETGVTDTVLRLRLPGGRLTTIRADADEAGNLRPGTFLPVRPEPTGGSDLREDWRPAWDLAADTVAWVLLDHRRSLGLLDEYAEDLLRRPRPETYPMSAIRPTGRVRAGQVEVVITFLRESSALSVQGFLRPDEVAAVRHAGAVVVTELAVRRPEREGRWALWPLWF